MMPAIRMTVVITVLMALLSTPAVQAGPILEWLCGCSQNMTSSSTYAPAYVPPVETPAPATNCVPVPQQTTYYAPAVAWPAPITAYRLLPVVPRPTPSYPSQYNPYSAAPVTLYRPVVPVVTTTRLIPYTSYRMVYPTVATYGYAPAIVAPPPPCTIYGGAPVENAVPQPMANPAELAMEAPSLSPSDPTTSNYVPLTPPTITNYAPLEFPSTVVEKPYSVEKSLRVEKPADGSSSATGRDNKSDSAPSSDQKQTPADDSKSAGPNLTAPNPPDQPTAKPNSLIGPQPRENRDRTTMRPVRQASREKPASPQPAVRVLSADLWKPVLD
jgi:hypothetical protein